jgi:S-adenosylmethionine:tRNA ribosyltransferase-isomerase
VLIERGERGEWLARPVPAADAAALLARVGQTPLPPYIARPAHPTPADAERYQTVYAARAGAAAAPTAGLHFTPQLLAALRAAGVATAFVTLHVGMGTFAPIDVEELGEHAMHAEWFEAPAAALAAADATRAAGGRVIAVGTTSVRVLESAARVRAGAPAGTLPGAQATEAGVSGWTNIFIYPPYEFRLVDALLTNFHLPGSTLLALVMALAGVERIRAAYSAAIAERYRFYSFGDAMLIV